jgi:type I restriction enzyme R subunit
MNEAETRAEKIDPALKAAGWGEIEGSRIHREYSITPGRIEGQGRRGRTEIADYVLIYKNRKLAVIEAKAWDKPLTEGLAQAKSHAGKLMVKMAYATNGQGIYAVDMHTAHEAEIEKYPTPEELWKITFHETNAWRDRFADIAPERRGNREARYYQDISIDRVLEAISDGRKRILLTLATGTGKTEIAFQIAWKLFQSRWNLSGSPSRRPRILFLADRNTLANQAYNAFSNFAEEALVRIKPDEVRKRGQVPKNGNIFFTIFQTFMSGPEGTPYFGDYPPDFFDFIIIDECHRGGASDESTWRKILDYFEPAVQLGLTATPKRRFNADTYAYFGEPVFIYSLKDGINDGYLTPFRVRQISTTLDEYVYTSDDRLIEGDVEEGRRYTESDFNRIIEIRQREAYRVSLYMQRIDQREKTIVFCATQDHALAVRDLVNQMKTSRNPNYCVRVTADDGEIGEQFLRDFQNNEKSIPTILTTSKKLSTGVDARNVRNIVLMRPVNDIIEFKQIIGRGTRLYDGKDYFTIYDFVKAHEHFQDPEWDGEPLPPDGDNDNETEGGSAEGGHGEPGGQRNEAAGNGDGERNRRQRIRVKLADGKERTIQHMMVTTFWHPDGKPMSAQEFMENLFGAIPEMFSNEEELRLLWSNPESRRSLLEKLQERGYGKDQLLEMQRIIDAENSDLFDVLAYLAYLKPTITRQERAEHARNQLTSQFSEKQVRFLDFVLQQYVAHGVEELSPEKLSALLRLKYQNALADAVADLGKPEQIKSTFFTFQKNLYNFNEASPGRWV